MVNKVPKEQFIAKMIRLCDLNTDRIDISILENIQYIEYKKYAKYKVLEHINI